MYDEIVVDPCHRAWASYLHHFTISSVVDPAARAGDTRVLVHRTADGDTFAEQHRQYFHTVAQVLDALLDAGLALTAVTEEYSDQPADASTLRATWTARRDPE